MRMPGAAQRDNHFVSQGFRVLRLWNNEIDRNLDGVLTLIDDALHNPPSGRLRRPPSPAEVGYIRLRPP
jgi:very-short-patch-repair endonuclease